MTNQLSPEREAELEQARNFTHNGWRIADDCGMPCSEAAKVWEMVHLEMKFHCPDFMRGLSIASYAKSWIETRNPYFIDAAVVLCRRSGVDPPPSLMALVGDVAALRFDGEARGGTAAKIRKQNARDYAFNLMANLCAAGASREIAASKAAKYLADIGAGISYKASSLEKDYPQHWRDMEADKTDTFHQPQNASLLTEWQRILAMLPEANDELKGERR